MSTPHFKKPLYNIIKPARAWPIHKAADQSQLLLVTSHPAATESCLGGAQITSIASSHVFCQVDPVVRDGASASAQLEAPDPLHRIAWNVRYW